MAFRSLITFFKPSEWLALAGITGLVGTGVVSVFDITFNDRIMEEERLRIEGEKNEVDKSKAGRFQKRFYSMSQREMKALDTLDELEWQLKDRKRLLKEHEQRENKRIVKVKI